MLGKMLSNIALVLLCIMLTRLGDEDGSIIQQPIWMKMHALFAVYVVDVSNHLCRSQQGGVQWTGLLYGPKTDSDHF